MSAIAHLLLSKGERVSGSDLKENRITHALAQKGARIFIGHHTQNLIDADTVVYSSAIKEDNPELAAARAQGKRVLQRAQALAELMEGKVAITVTGSHGKTTTSSLTAHLLREAGFSPSLAIGGIFKNLGLNASQGKGGFFVAEADESDGSFLYYRPRYSIITNIDREHLDYYGTFENALEAYRTFMGQTQDSGCLFCCRDDPNIMRLLKGVKARHVLFGLHDDADIYPARIEFTGLSSDFDCMYRDKLLARFRLALGGLHNISNALSVAALGLELGIGVETIASVFASYQGAGRRLDVKFRSPEVTVIDDYAHHPTEIKATLAAVRLMRPRRLIAVFQPHRYSRTKLLLDEFGQSFAGADRVVVTDIYPAGEAPLPGVTAQALAEAIKRHFPDTPVDCLAKEAVADAIVALIEPGDCAVMLGAGDITRISDAVAERLKKQG